MRLAEDWDLWLRLAARGEPFVCAPDAVVRYRRHPGGLTADVAALARCQLELHRAHGALVEPAVRERALAADEAALRSATRTGLRALIPRRDPYRRYAASPLAATARRRSRSAARVVRSRPLWRH